jgi:hypothetical protein
MFNAPSDFVEEPMNKTRGANEIPAHSFRAKIKSRL